MKNLSCNQGEMKTSKKVNRGMMKLISLMLVFIMVFASFAVVPVEAAAKVVTQGYYKEWILYDDGTLYVNKDFDHVYNVKDGKQYAELNGKVKTVVFDKSVTVLRGCTDFYNLEEIRVEGKPTKVDEQAFWGCTALEEIALPNTITSIGQSAFYKCFSLEEVSLPEKLQSIGAWAFADCPNLESIAFPASLKTIDQYAFLNDDSLTEIRFYGVPTKIDRTAFFGIKATGYCPMSGGAIFNVKDTAYTTNQGKITWKKSTSMRRLYGSTRYDTALEIADAYKVDSGQSKFSSIIVACGTNFPDALAASCLAAKTKSPVIVLGPRNLTEVQNYIKKNVKQKGTVYLLGGSAVVSDSIKNGMKNYTFKRLYDEDRYGTNVKILKQAKVTSGEILVCDGTTFQNALIASATGKPVLLVRKDKLTKEQRDYLKTLNNPRFTIIGDEESVTYKIESALKSYGKVSRIDAESPDEVSYEVATKYFKSATEVTLAIDNNFPDGLCGGPLAIAGKGPILLVSKNNYSDSLAYCKGKTLTRINVLGGPTLVSDEIAIRMMTVKNK